MSEETQRVPILRLAREVVARRWRIAAIALGVPLACTLGAALFLPRSYRSTAVVVVERGAGVSDDDVDARLSVLSSENVRRSRLHALISRFKPYGDPARGGSREAQIDQLLKDVRIEQEKEDRGGRSVTSAIEVTFTAKSPQLAADVANEFAAFYEREDLRMREERAQRATTKVQEQLTDAKKRLDEQAARLKDYKMRNLNELPEQVGLHLAELAQLNSQMRARSEPSATRSDSVRPPSEMPEYDERLDRLAALRTRFTDEHPEVKQLKREIELNPMRRRAVVAPDGRADDGADSAALASARMENARRRISELSEKAALHEQGILNAPFRQQELEAMLPDYIAARNQYQTLWEKYELAKAWDPHHDGGRLVLLDPAVARKQAVAPSIRKILAIGLAVALMIAAAVVVLVERMDTSFHTADDLRVFTRVPVLAIVPRLVTPNEQRRKAKESRMLVAKFLVLLVFMFASSAYLSRSTETVVTWIHQIRP
jgi:polysaccharide biosynthesis transport protein